MMCRYGQRLNQVHNQKRQFLFTKSTELIRRVSFTKQPSLINNKPVHFVFYRDRMQDYTTPNHIDDRDPRTKIGGSNVKYAYTIMAESKRS